jgi:hypothetical protein
MSMTTRARTARSDTVALVCAVCLAAACHRGPTLVGTWEGAPQTQDVVHQATKGQANPVAESFVNAAAQGLANALLSVRIELRPDGIAYYSGATASLGLPPASSGPWYVISQHGDA